MDEWKARERTAFLPLLDSSYVVVPSASTLNPTAAITIAAWVKAEDWDGNGRIVQKGDGDTQYRLLDEGDLLFELDGVTGEVITAPLPSVGEWHHVVGTYDGSTISIYVDGTLANSGGRERQHCHYCRQPLHRRQGPRLAV